MIKLYTLLPSTDPNEVGAYPQVAIDGSQHPYNIRASDSIWKIPSDGEIGFIPAIPNFKLDDGAKLTDFINSSYSSHYLILISSRLLELIKKSNIGSYNILPTIIKNQAQEEQYYFFRLMNAKHNVYINWQTTIWGAYYLDTQTYKLIEESSFSANSYEDLAEMRKKIRQDKGRRAIQLKQLVLNNAVVFDDMFFLKIHSNLVVSEQLKNKIEANGLTGMKFKEVPYKLDTIL